ncbi:MAG: SDR family NAD(P)-dependent oxidoreductase [Pirellulales bacterium]
MLAEAGLTAAALDVAADSLDAAAPDSAPAAATGSPSGQTILAATPAVAKPAASPAAPSVTIAEQVAIPTVRTRGTAEEGKQVPSGLEQRLTRYLKREFIRVLRLADDDFDSTTNFMDLGFDSILALQIRKALCEDSGSDLDSTVLFRYPSVAELARYLTSTPEHALKFAKLVEACTTRETSESMRTLSEARIAENVVGRETLSELATSGSRSRLLPTTIAGRISRDVESLATADAIAVIGMACRFPGAANIEEFWENLRRGVDSVREVPPSRWDWRTTYDPSGESQGSSRSKWGGFVEGVEDFDPGFFHISPHEARLMDPQQRLFLEVAWETFERAGYRPDRLGECHCGVFVGASGSDYATLLHHSGEATDPHLQSGNATSLVATRLSYLLNLRGPSLTVDTACSSALVAVHLACQSLKSGDAELAIAGGVNLILNPAGMVLVSQFGMLAGDGRCKAFDEQADGFVRGEGAAAVLLKPLSKALVDGDQILGVLRGTAINNDGHSKAGLAAPNPKAQEEVVVEAHRAAGVQPATICYLEAHGTGTALGDPIELDGLTHAFARQTSAHGYCAIGSVKSNVGHLEAAAGIAGLIKAILVVRHGELPPTLHVGQPNRNIRFEASPFFVNDRLRPWPVVQPAGSPHNRLPAKLATSEQAGLLRRAGVSAFGFGGTNVHAIVEQPPDRPQQVASDSRLAHLLVLSAGSRAALRNLSEAYEKSLASRDDWTLDGVCSTASFGRKPGNVRLAIVLRYREQLADKLELFRLGNDAQRLERAGIFSGTVQSDATAIAVPKSRVVEEIEQLSDSSLQLIAQTCSGEVIEELIAPWLRTRGLAELVGNVEATTPAGDVWNRLPSEEQIKLATLLARLFVYGAEIEWEPLYGVGNRRRELLPTYPFERRRCWVTVDRSHSESVPLRKDEDQPQAAGNVRTPQLEMREHCATAPTVRASDVDRLLYQAIWRPSPWPSSPTHGALGSIGRGGATWLIVGRHDKLSEGICDFLRANHHQVIEVRSGSHFRVESDDTIWIDPSRRKHWRRLLTTLAEWQTKVAHVVALWPAQDPSFTDSAEAVAVANGHAVRMLRLAQALLKANTTAVMDLRLVTRGSQHVLAQSRLEFPEAAVLWGMAQSLEREHPLVQVKCTDLDPSQPGAVGASQLIREWSSEATERQVAFRDGQRFVLDLQPLDLLTVARQSPPLRRGGVYLVTGGLGGIGLAVARWLAEEYGANLVLAGRTIPPTTGDRAAWLATHPQRAAWRRKLEWLTAIERAAPSVSLRSIDVGDVAAVRELVADVRKQFGQIDAVFHTAGVYADGPVETVTPDQVKQVLRPKFAGAVAIDAALADTPQVPRVYFSSVAGLLGSPNQCSYSAANRGLDALASWQRAGGRSALSIDWGLWGEVGMGVPVVDRVRQSGVLEPLATVAALAALERVLSFNLPQVIVASWGPIGWSGTFGWRDGAPKPALKTLGEPRSEKPAMLPPSSNLSASEAERLLTMRVARLLELDEGAIARHRTFAELGLDSILVVQLLRELEGWLGRTFAPTLLRDFPNVAALAKFITRA